MKSGAIVLEVPDLDDGVVALRPWEVADASCLAAAWTDPAILAGARPPDDRSEKAARRWIEGCDLRRRAGVALDLVITGAGDDTVIGEVGLSRFDIARRAAMVGWWVAADFRGEGHASRGVRALVDWALDDGRLLAVIAEIGADNPASEGVARASGFEVLRPAGDGRPGVWVRRARATFRSRP